MARGGFGTEACKIVSRNKQITTITGYSSFIMDSQSAQQARLLRNAPM